MSIQLLLLLKKHLENTEAILMNTKKLATMVLALMLVLAAFPVMAASVTPTVIPGNPTCIGLGYDFGFKIDPPTPGVYPVGNGSITWTSADGVYLDWTSTFGIDAVLVKGGPNAHLYVYNPPALAFGDTGLHSPIGPNGNPAGISHLEFCFNAEGEIPEALITIEKSVTPELIALPTDSTIVTYTIVVSSIGQTDALDVVLEDNFDAFYFAELEMYCLSIENLSYEIGENSGPVTVVAPAVLPGAPPLRIEVGTLAVGESLSVTFEADLADCGVGGFPNTAHASASNAPEVEDDAFVSIGRPSAVTLGGFAAQGSSVFGQLTLASLGGVALVLTRRRRR